MPKLINYSHVASMAFNTPLYATPDLAASVKAFLLPKMKGQDLGSPQMGTESEEGQKVVKKSDNIAVIPVHGVLTVRRGNINAACEEIESYERLRSRVCKAMNDVQVDAIVLDFYTGGGSAMGCKEMADFIFECKQTKPIYGIVNFAAFSAGYFILSACTEIYISETATVGSIGVIWEHVDWSRWLENEGVAVTTLYRGDHKNDCSPNAPLSPEALQGINEQLDTAYELFSQSVATYRNLPVESIVSTQAKTFHGQQAIELGLADHKLTPQEAINHIASRHPFEPIYDNSRSISMQAAAIDTESQL